MENVKLQALKTLLSKEQIEDITRVLDEYKFDVLAARPKIMQLLNSFGMRDEVKVDEAFLLIADPDVYNNIK